MIDGLARFDIERNYWNGSIPVTFRSGNFAAVCKGLNANAGDSGIEKGTHALLARTFWPTKRAIVVKFYRCI